MNSLFSRIHRIVRSNFSKHPKIEGWHTPNVSEDLPWSEDDPSQSSWSEQELAYYANLEVSPGAPFSLIQTSYRKLLKKYHPDLYNEDQAKRAIAADITSRLNEAYRYFRAARRHQAG